MSENFIHQKPHLPFTVEKQSLRVLIFVLTIKELLPCQVWLMCVNFEFEAKILNLDCQAGQLGAGGAHWQCSHLTSMKFWI